MGIFDETDWDSIHRAIAGNPRKPWVPEDGDSKCQKCYRDNPVWCANNEEWNRLMPNDGILCPTCYHRIWMENR